MKNFTRFASYFADYMEAKKYGRTEDIQVSRYHFTKKTLHGLKECKIFEITDDTKRLLALTKTPRQNDMYKLPFPVIFIDVGFKNDEMKKLGFEIGYGEIVGIMVAEGDLILDKEHPVQTEEGTLIDSAHFPSSKEHEVIVGKTLRITILSITEGRIWFDVFNEEYNIFDKYKDYKFKVARVKYMDRQSRKFIHLFVLNFLNFIHNPEVEFITVERDEKRNAKRLAKGKVPIPERRIIKLTGVLKKYTDELKAHPLWHYHYRFWVRGHFRTFRHPKWGERVGTRSWIPPFIKGKGVLIEKTYLVEKKDGDVDE